MKKAILILFICGAAISFAKTKKSPVEKKPKIVQMLEDADMKLKAMDCPFMVKLYNPNDPLDHPLGFCLYTHREERGMFAAVACVGAIAEPDTQSKNAFYGSRGHWGIDGTCEGEAMKKKFVDPEIDKTVNPITDIRQKRKAGMKLKKLRDDFGIFALFNERTTPK